MMKIMIGLCVLLLTHSAAAHAQQTAAGAYACGRINQETASPGELDRYAECLREEIERSHERTAAYRNARALLALQREAYEEAAVLLKGAVSLDPGNEEYRENLHGVEYILQTR